MEATRPRISPSFLFAIALLVAVAGVYAAWQVRHLGPNGMSDAVVRDFVDELQEDLAAYRREIGAVLTRERVPVRDLAAAGRSIEALAAEALAQVEARVQAARRRLEALEHLPVTTLRNRLARIDKRAGEARGLVAELAHSTKEQLSSGSAPGGSAPAS